MKKSQVLYLETLGGLNLGQNEVCMLSISSRKWCQKFGGIQKHIIVSISFIITNICKKCVLCGLCNMFFNICNI